MYSTTSWTSSKSWAKFSGKGCQKVPEMSNRQDVVGNQRKVDTSNFEARRSMSNPHKGYQVSYRENQGKQKKVKKRDHI
jgi:hypothetical protein